MERPSAKVDIENDPPDQHCYAMFKKTDVKNGKRRDRKANRPHTSKTCVIQQVFNWQLKQASMC